MAIELGFKDDAPEILDARVRDTLKVLDDFYDMYAADAQEAGKLLALAFHGDQRILAAGLGSSSCLAAMLPMRFMRDAEGRSPLPVHVLSGVPCDEVYDQEARNLFLARQVEALGNDGDVLILLTTDGMHPALIEAARTAREQNMFVLGLTGGDGGQLASEELLDLELRVPSIEDALIQEVHLNLVCLLEELCGYYLFGKPELIDEMLSTRAQALLDDLGE